MRIEKNSRPGGTPEHLTDNESALSGKTVQAASGSQVKTTPEHSVGAELTLSTQVPYLRAEEFRPILSQQNRAYIEVRNGGNPYALPIGSGQVNNLFRASARESGTTLKKWELEEINEQLIAAVEMAGQVTEVWYRVAPLPCDGFEIDLGDAAHTRVRVTAGNVDISKTGSEIVFCRTPTMLPLPMPAEESDLQLLRDKVNLDDDSYFLLLAWLTFTLASPKKPSTKFVGLHLLGGQGSSKSFMSKEIIQAFTDPNQLGAQVFPRNARDLAIMAEHTHLLIFDNMRNFRAEMSDILCMMSTGGTLSSRALYSNGDLFTSHIHGAVLMNGIHHLLTQPDLSERFLTLHTQFIEPSARKSEAQLIRDLERDKPAIFRGLLDLTAKILVELPDAVVEHPQRMLDFVRWLAAMERALRFPDPVLQRQYAASLREAQLDSLLDNLLGDAVVEFAGTLKGDWNGQSSELLAELNERASHGTASAREWPQNSIALSKRLRGLQASLRTQGITVEIGGRGKKRRVVIRVEAARDE